MKDNNTVSKGFKMTELGPLPEDWEVARLGDVAKVKYGKANPKDTGEIPVVGSGGVYSGTVNPLVDYPTMVIGRKGTAGKVWLFLKPCYPSDTTFYLEWKKDTEIFFLFNYMVFNPLSGEHAKTTLPSLQKPDLENFLIPYPPLPEQEKIAAVLSAVQEAKEKTETVIRTARELKKSLMKHLFTYGPVPIEEAESVPMKKTEIGMVPEGWKVVRIEEAGKIITGTTPRTEYKEYYGDEYQFISPFDLGNTKYVYSAQKYLSEKGLKVSRPLPRDSILVTCIGSTIGKIGMTFEKVSATNQQINSMICNRDFNAHFVYYYLSFNSDRIKSLASTVAVPILNKSNFENFKILLPPLSIQQKIADILSTVDRKIQAEENKKKALKELFKTLLNNLMTAKIRVAHLEIAV